MNLQKEQWNKEEIKEFENYLLKLALPPKQEWWKNSLKINKDVLAIPTKEVRRIANEISKGNFYSFLDLKLFINHETISIYGFLISKIDNLDLLENYLDKYTKVLDSWAHVDLLRLPITKDNLEFFLKLSNKYLKSKEELVRRLGLFILMEAILKGYALKKIFTTIKTLDDEKEYYVIMMAGWLLCECIILYKDESLGFLDSTKINPLILNKTIQKCRESLRLSKEFKDELLLYKH